MRVVPMANGIDTATQSWGRLHSAFVPSFFITTLFNIKLLYHEAELHARCPLHR